jgi:basic membrane protein A
MTPKSSLSSARLASPARRFRYLFALLAGFSLIAAACGSDSEDAASVSTSDCGTDTSFDEASEPVTDLSVAIVAPSASDDLAFTQSMVDAVEALGLEPQITDGTFQVEAAAEAIRGYADSGVDIVIAHGTQFGGSLAEIAPDFPNTSFVWGTSNETQGLENVFAYTPAADQGAYVMGTIAAQLSESGQIGMVGPIDAGDASLYVQGFVAGAEAEGASTNVTFTGSFGDVALATEAAQAHLDVGSDVLTGTAQHVVGAIQIADANGIPWFGTQANQESQAPELVVASQVYHWEVVLDDMITQIEDGTLGGEVYELTLENGGLVIEFNGCYDLDSDIKDGAVDTIDAIIDGSIKPLG